MAKRVTQRQKLLGQLGDQRRRLMQKGVLLRDLDYLFGVPSNKKFGDYSTQELAKIKDRVDSFGRKEVLDDGRILTQSYKRGMKLYTQETGKPTGVPYDLSRQYNSFLSRFKTRSDVKQYVKGIQNQAFNYYLNNLYIIDPEAAKAFAKYNPEDALELIKNNSQLIGFDKLKSSFLQLSIGSDITTVIYGDSSRDDTVFNMEHEAVDTYNQNIRTVLGLNVESRPSKGYTAKTTVGEIRDRLKGLKGLDK